MVEVEVIEIFTLKEFKKLKDIKRAIKEHEDAKYDGKLYPRDTFKCDNEMAKYLTGANPLRKIVVKVIEVEPEEVSEKVVQEVANAIVDEAKEQDKSIEEIVNEIQEEEKELIYCGDKQTQPQYETKSNKKKKSSKK